ncbi:transposase [Mucilaginibacter sp.]|uniref:transposase n=1 Tax=Mucilaginibacter sp. TaxID=1882438 RepID=UPI0026398D51|nr:transposase [Mucilaginibacter sp.]MDB4919329.1 hypothetical protein [Mucilaginibacter sp.]
MKYNPLIHNRRSIRLKGYDYSQAGAYFITICTNQRQPLFGEIINGEMILSEIGQIAYNEWLKTPEIRPYVSLDVFVIMPNHMHGIILINDDPTTSKGVSHTLQGIDVFTSPLRSPSHNIGAIVRGYKSAVTKQINLLDYGDTVWHRNYHEHIIRNEPSYLRISDYIINNPSKWIEDTFYIK